MSMNVFSGATLPISRRVTCTSLWQVSWLGLNKSFSFPFPKSETVDVNDSLPYSGGTALDLHQFPFSTF